MEANQTFIEQNISCVLPYNITENQWTFYYSFSWWLEGFGSIMIGSMGIISNVITINVLLGSDLAASFFNWLLVCLAIFDNFCLLNGILEAFRRHIGSTSLHHYVFVIFLYPFRNTVMCCSIYITVILALERYNALAAPTTCHRKNSLFRTQRSLKTYCVMHWARVMKYVGPIIIFSSLFYIPKLFELRLVKYEVCAKNETASNCWYKSEVELAELRNNTPYILWYLNVANLLVTVIIPLTSLAYLNFNIFRKLKKYVERRPSVATSEFGVGIADGGTHRKLQRRDKDMIQQTTVLFAIVILFVLFHTLRIILNIDEFVTIDNSDKANESGCTWLQYWTIIAVPVSHLLLQINSSINLFIYCVFNKSFRSVMKSKLFSIYSLF